MKILIVSLRYSPVHYSLCHTLGEVLQEKGCIINYLFSRSQKWMIPLSELNRVSFLGSSKKLADLIWDSIYLSCIRPKQISSFLNKIRPDLILFESSHPLNVFIARLASSFNPAIKTWMLLHEPKVRKKIEHGLIQSISILGHEWWTRRLLPNITGVIVPSDVAEEQMKAAYPSYKGYLIKVPLLFLDRNMSYPNRRRYFTFVGHAVRAKGIDIFFDLVRSAAEERLDLEFQIVSSSRIGAYLNRLPSATRSSLKIVNKELLLDKEIDEAIRESWAILAPYRRVTQSGVLPIAYMHGTPVISLQSQAMMESVVNGYTGWLISRDASFAEWCQAMNNILSDFQRFSNNCRSYFLKHHDAKLGQKLLERMLELSTLGHKASEIGHS